MDRSSPSPTISSPPPDRVRPAGADDHGLTSGSSDRRGRGARARWFARRGRVRRTVRPCGSAN